jgi:hypothetical protein
MGLLDEDFHQALRRGPRMRRRGLLDPAADYARGGVVRRRGLLDPDPPGPDQGFAALRAGERVLNERQWRMLSAKARAEIEAAFEKTGANKGNPRSGYAEGGEVTAPSADDKPWLERAGEQLRDEVMRIAAPALHLAVSRPSNGRLLSLPGVWYGLEKQALAGNELIMNGWEAMAPAGSSFETWARDGRQGVEQRKQNLERRYRRINPHGDFLGEAIGESILPFGLAHRILRLFP